MYKCKKLDEKWEQKGMDEVVHLIKEWEVEELHLCMDENM